MLKSRFARRVVTQDYALRRARMYWVENDHMYISLGHLRVKYNQKHIRGRTGIHANFLCSSTMSGKRNKNYTTRLEYFVYMVTHLRIAVIGTCKSPESFLTSYMVTFVMQNRTELFHHTHVRYINLCPILWLLFFSLPFEVSSLWNLPLLGVDIWERFCTRLHRGTICVKTNRLCFASDHQKCCPRIEVICLT